MEVKLSEEYEELAIEWQYQIILLLKQTLKKKGIDDAIAKDVIGDFVFDLSMLHDQGEIKLDGKSYNPRICFDDFSGSLVATDEETGLHEYAFGSTGEAFGG
ncbi:hypothetical protein [Mangrovitalea sediminis]|uniref:hypothetical protein n=1 Tax=Mangrovitalea sediminis TaxID=1982043 RepID=UPI000BE5D9F8|nr:hypothetical protein [Mangrovitalea sediminis]